MQSLILRLAPFYILCGVIFLCLGVYYHILEIGFAGLALMVLGAIFTYQHRALRKMTADKPNT